jgi:hypothetical protein
MPETSSEELRRMKVQQRFPIARRVQFHEVFEHGDQGTGYYLDAGARLNWEGDGREPVDARGTRERAAKRVRFD